MRLSTRVGIAVGTTAPLLVLASGWLLLHLVGHDLHRAEDQHLRQRAAAVAPDARQLLRASRNGRPKAADLRERKLFDAALDVGVRVVAPGVDFTGGPQPGPAVALPEHPTGTVAVHDGNRTWRALARLLGDGSGTLWVFAPDTADRAQLQLVRRRVVLTALLAAPVSGLLAWGLAAGASAPLRRLTRRTAGLDPRTKGSGTRPDERRTGVTEVDELAATLRTVLARYDEQAARTAEALDTARSFSSAAAHELRTPLMSMGTNLDILAAHPGLPDPDRAEVVTDLRHEHARMRGLLAMLRDLGRGDLVEAEALRDVDLADLADTAVAEARRHAPDAVITLTAPPGLTVHGWEPGLRLLLDNLLANALAHGRDTEGRAHIELTARETADGIHLTVDDTGPGVPPADRARVFDRFRRGPGSAGSGLGLTLVAQQAALHRGSVSVGDTPHGTGARFTVRLPSGGGDLPGHRDWLIGVTRT